MRGIYLRTDPNGKHYVGLSCDIERRWKEENYEALHPQRTHDNDLYFALKYFGVNRFANKVLEEIPYDESKNVYENAEILSEREKHWIEVYNSYYDGYNKTRGGSGVATSQSEQRNIFESRKEEILEAINEGITQDLFVDRFKISASYYNVLREQSGVEADGFKYLDAHGQLNKGLKIWYDKKHNHASKRGVVKKDQKGIVQWVTIDKAIFKQSKKHGRKSKSMQFVKNERKNGLMIENKIYFPDGHFAYVNADGTKITKKFALENPPTWATQELIEKANRYFEKEEKK